MGRRDGGGKKKQSHDQTRGFDVYIESMEKKMMKKNEHRPERERKREEKKGRSRLEGKKERHTLHA